ncbi:hypothetical protein [Pseudomonas aeruginosa]|uniref:hypothetical protein n=1 Tax=Pseudomonas aeruginosa TaxID=287 RepID=UPI00113FCD99|nr:hypothetical protein [Pseudomonas aeruginosa]
MPSPTPLYQIEECPDLYVDACVCDEQRNLVFLSAWGRDTVTQEFLARLTLGREERCIWYNHERLLSSLGYIPPVEAEANFHQQQVSQAMAA